MSLNDQTLFSSITVSIAVFPCPLEIIITAPIAHVRIRNCIAHVGREIVEIQNMFCLAHSGGAWPRTALPSELILLIEV